MQDSDPELYRECVEAMGEILLPERTGRRAAGSKD